LVRVRVYYVSIILVRVRVYYLSIILVRVRVSKRTYVEVAGHPKDIHPAIARLLTQ